MAPQVSPLVSLTPLPTSSGSDFSRMIQNQVDFGNSKPGDADLEAEINRNEALQLDGEDRLIPAPVSTSRLSAMT